MPRDAQLDRPRLATSEKDVCEKTRQQTEPLVHDSLNKVGQPAGTDCCGSTLTCQNGLASATALAMLSACGGGDSGQASSTSVPTAVNTTVSLSPGQLRDASRFLSQGSTGANFGTIERLARGTYDGWLEAQFATSRDLSYFDWLVEHGFTEPSFKHHSSVWQGPLWRGLLSGSDVLRQRTTLALLDLFVVGILQIDSFWRSASMANYLDLLAENAFGNFRQLLEDVTYSTAMGSWLTYIGSKKADGRGGAPDENYAREIMQLFTIGLFELDEDGTHKLDSRGHAIPSYQQADVEGLAKVFTGMTHATDDRESPERHRERLVIDPRHNETGLATFLGQNVQGGGEAAVSQALDILFYHPNVGPFVSRRLIQSLVTSNPSRGYVRRVASVFANNGAGERGDLRAVWKAILLDPEARSEPATYAGKLRDPTLRLLNWAKAFNVRDETGTWSLPSFWLLQNHAPGWSPTVFNFFQPNYSPPHTEINRQGLLAPEFQLANDYSAISYINFFERVVDGYLGFWKLEPDFSEYFELAPTAAILVERLNLVLAAGRVSSETVRAIENAVSSLPSATDVDKERRIKLATLAVMSSPDYLVME